MSKNSKPTINKLIHLNTTTFPSHSQQDESCFDVEGITQNAKPIKQKKEFFPL